MSESPARRSLGGSLDEALNVRLMKVGALEFQKYLREELFSKSVGLRESMFGSVKQATYVSGSETISDSFL